MRQAGILAAAGLIALEEGPGRLHEDHANARLLAEAVEPFVDVDLDGVQTNIVIFALKNGGDAAGFVAKLKENGVVGSAIGASAVRLVTHCDVSREDCEKAAKVAVELLES